MPTPETLARQNIDAQLAACGWVVQDHTRINLYAGRGVVVREFALQTGYAGYLLFVDRKAARAGQLRQSILKRAFEGKLVDPERAQAQPG